MIRFCKSKITKFFSDKLVITKGKGATLMNKKEKEKKMEQILYYGQIEVKQEKFHLVASEKGLVFVGSPNNSIEEIYKWYPTGKLKENQKQVEKYAKALESYFIGNKKSFQLPLDIKGTSFQEKVWAFLVNIPYGETMSYSEIAEKIKHPKAARAVGRAVGANPILLFVPCHRVVGKNGKSTGYRGGVAFKERLLQMESGANHEGD